MQKELTLYANEYTQERSGNTVYDLIAEINERARTTSHNNEDVCPWRERAINSAPTTGAQPTNDSSNTSYAPTTRHQKQTDSKLPQKQLVCLSCGSSCATNFLLALIGFLLFVGLITRD